MHPCLIAVPTQSVPVSPPPIIITFFPAAKISFPLLKLEPVILFVLLVKYSTAKWMLAKFLPGTFKSLGFDAPTVTITASFSFASLSKLISFPTLTQVLKIIPSS